MKITVIMASATKLQQKNNVNINQSIQTLSMKEALLQLKVT